MINKGNRVTDKQTDLQFVRLISYLNRKISDVIPLIVDDTTPSVKTGNKFKTANANATTITQLDDGEDGQELMIITGDANTTINHGGNFSLSGAANWTPGANEALKLIKSGSLWIEPR